MCCNAAGRLLITGLVVRSPPPPGVAVEKSFLLRKKSEITKSSLSSGHDKSCLNSINAKKKRAAVLPFFIYCSTGYTGPFFMKGKEILPSHSSLRPQMDSLTV